MHAQRSKVTIIVLVVTPRRKCRIMLVARLIEERIKRRKPLLFWMQKSRLERKRKADEIDLILTARRGSFQRGNKAEGAVVAMGE